MLEGGAQSQALKHLNCAWQPVKFGQHIFKKKLHQTWSRLFLTVPSPVLCCVPGWATPSHPQIRTPTLSSSRVSVPCFFSPFSSLSLSWDRVLLPRLGYFFTPRYINPF